VKPSKKVRGTLHPATYFCSAAAVLREQPQRNLALPACDLGFYVRRVVSNTGDEKGGARARVLLADDQAATIRRWRTLLEPQFEVVGDVADGEALVSEAARLAPDVIVANIAIPALSGVSAAQTIMRAHPSARIVFATVDADRTMLRKGLAAGALGYVLKVRDTEDLVPAVRAALRGELMISPFPFDDEKASER
jgi:CheY-like chemotaxis protein